MTKKFTDQSNQARSTAEQLAELDRLAKQTAELPELRRRLRYEQARAQAEQDLAEAKSRARKRLEEIKPRVKEWQAQFLAASATLEALTAELPSLQAVIFEAGYEVREAAENLARFDPRLAQSPMPGAAMGPHWAEAGGTDDALSFAPDQPQNQFYTRLTAHLFRSSPVYKPHAWIWSFYTG